MERQSIKENEFELEKWLERLINGELPDQDEKTDPEAEIWERLKKDIENVLDEPTKEEFRWINGLSDDRPATFSRRWAQRWVCKKAYDLGWSDDLFEHFEKYYCHTDYSRSPRKIVRIGKKYQWVAFHELLAKMADNLHWIDHNYEDVDDRQYYGP